MNTQHNEQNQTGTPNETPQTGAPQKKQQSKKHIIIGVIVTLIILWCLGKLMGSNDSNNNYSNNDSDNTYSDKQTLDDCFDHENVKSCKKACELNDIDACLRAGIIERDKCDIFSLDYKHCSMNEATKYLLKACTSHDTLGIGCFNYVKMFTYQLDKNKNTDYNIKDKIVTSWENDCEKKNDGPACFLLSLAYDNNIHSSIIDNNTHLREYNANKYRQRACELSEAVACDSLASHTNNPSDEVKYRQKSCDIGFGYACYRLASRFDNGSAEKTIYLKKACDDLNHALACIALADTYADGSVEKSKYLEKACKINPRNRRCSE